jgi:transcriptional regulator with XRE-family HTH domain
MAKKWSELRAERERLDQDDHAEEAAAARADLRAELVAHAFTLGELRRARALTQVQLAGALDVSQAQVSRIEKQADLLLSTLASYVEAMGGDLELVVTFPDHPPVHLAVGELASMTERRGGGGGIRAEDSRQGEEKMIVKTIVTGTRSTSPSRET